MKTVFRKYQKSKIQGFTIIGNISLISIAYQVQKPKSPFIFTMKLHSAHLCTNMSVKTKTKNKKQKQKIKPTVASCLFTFLDSVKWETHL